MYFEVFKFIVIFAGYELNPLKQVKYKTIYKMRKVSLFIAMSLDGYIADTRGEVNWIVGQSSDIENLDTYSKFIRDIDIILMGGIPIIKLLLNFR